MRSPFSSRPYSLFVFEKPLPALVYWAHSHAPVFKAYFPYPFPRLVFFRNLCAFSVVNSSWVFSLGFVMAGRSFLPVGVEKGQSISRLPFWVGIKFYCVLFYLTLIVLTLYLNGIFHHHYSIIVLIADCTALYLPSFECAAKQVIKYAFPSFSYRTTML